MTKPIRVLAMCGSLRAGSYNRMLLHHAISTLGDGYEVTIADLAGLPLYNDDMVSAPPPAVQTFVEQCRAAEGFLIATPEYNHSVSGVLKNALDWASRSAFGAPLTGKPVTLFGASNGPVGTARAQQAMRSILYMLKMDVVGLPEVLVSFAQNKFDEEGRFIDETGRKFLKQLLDAFAARLQRR